MFIYVFREDLSSLNTGRTSKITSPPLDSVHQNLTRLTRTFNCTRFVAFAVLFTPAEPAWRRNLGAHQPGVLHGSYAEQW